LTRRIQEPTVRNVPSDDRNLFDGYPTWKTGSDTISSVNRFAQNHQQY
jgi:hypothetical protein